MDMDATWTCYIYHRLEDFEKYVEHLIQEMETQKEDLQISVKTDMDFEVDERVLLRKLHQKIEDLGTYGEDIMIEVIENGSSALNGYANYQQVHANVGDDDHHDGGGDRHDSVVTSDDWSEENLHVNGEQKDSLRLEELLHMDFNNLKDVTWMKNIYQKLEEVGNGAEHIMQELQKLSEHLLDASMLKMDFRDMVDLELMERTCLNRIYHKVEELGKYVEDIIVEVGIQAQENGKRVYSNIQELLPSLNDSAKQEPVTEEISIINSLKPNEFYALYCHADNQQAHANVSDDSRETSGFSDDNLHVRKEQKGMNFIIHELNLALSEGETLVGQKEDSYGAELEQDSCSTVEENYIAPQVFDDLSLGDIEQQLDVDAFINSEMYYSCDSDLWGILADILDESFSMETNSQSSSEEGELINQGLSSSAESSDSSVVFQQGLVSCGSRQSVESNEGETLEPEYLAPLNNVSGIKHVEMNSAWKNTEIPLSPDIDADLNASTESKMEDIHLTDDEFEQTWEIIDDKEVHSIPHQQQGGSTTRC